MVNWISKIIFVIQVALSILNGVNGLCWEPNTTPFNGPPKASRIDGGDKRVRVDWSTSFNDGPGCETVDFLIMTHPRDEPSAYTLSDFTLKGQRSATLQLENDGDYVFQVIAREDKGEIHGIDYKYSDMITSYGNGGRNVPPQTPLRTPNSNNPISSRDEIQSSGIPSGSTDEQSESISVSSEDQFQAAEAPPTEYTDSNPWYIYECLPFLKDISGFPDYTNDGSQVSGQPRGQDATVNPNNNNVNPNKSKHNQALVDFIRHTNKNPLDMVNEFLASKKTGDGQLSLSCSPSDSGGSVYSASYDNLESEKVGKGYLVKKQCTGNDGNRGDVARQENEMCCSTPWSNICDKNDENDCFQDFFVCDGGKCIPNEWRNDGWPDCLDASDEKDGEDVGNTADDGALPSLPQQLVCVQCAGVILSAGFICRESDQGLTNSCLQETMGKGGACNPCIKLYLNLP